MRTRQMTKRAQWKLAKLVREFVLAHGGIEIETNPLGGLGGRMALPTICGTLHVTPLRQLDRVPVLRHGCGRGSLRLRPGPRPAQSVQRQVEFPFCGHSGSQCFRRIRGRGAAAARE